MSATMMNMELRFADHLLPNQLAEGDLVKLNDEYLTIKTIMERKKNIMKKLQLIETEEKL